MSSHLIRGDLLCQQGRFEMAAAEYQEALAADPTNASLLARLAVAHLRSGRWPEALRAAEAAREHEPSHPQSHWVCALVRLERSHLDSAEESVRRAIELDPDDADYFGLLARIGFERGRFEDALAAADQGLAHDPENDLCLTFRARALSALGRHEESAGVSEQLLESDPLDAWNHCIRGEDLLLQGRPHEARTHFLESLRLQPGNEAARSGLALALKARSPLFGTILSLLLRASRWKSSVLWGGVIVLFIAMRFGDAWAAANPAYGAFYEITKAVILGAFVVMFLANPMFDLILRFDREGRHALSTDELRATNWYLVCFVLAGLCAVTAAWTGKTLVLRPVSLAFLTLCLLVGQTFASPPGWVRRRMATITVSLGALLVFLPLGGPLLLVAAILLRAEWAMLLAMRLLLWAPIFVMVVCVFAENLREFFEKRRPD